MVSDVSLSQIRIVVVQVWVWIITDTNIYQVYMQKLSQLQTLKCMGFKFFEAWGNIDLKMKQLKGDTKSIWVGLVFRQLRPPEVITLFVVDTESPIKILKWTHSCGDLPFADCVLQSWGCSLQPVIMFLWLMIVDFEKVHKHKILFPSSHLA